MHKTRALSHLNLSIASFKYINYSTFFVTRIYLFFAVLKLSLRKYETRNKMSKVGWFGVVRVTQGHRK